jgi:hypothetical protein
MRGITLAAMALLALAGFAATNGQRPDAAAPQAAGGVTDTMITEAATRAVQARLPQRQAPHWDRVAVFRFGPEDERAVCGRVRASAEAAPQEVVARVLLPRTQARIASGSGARLVVVMEAGPGVQLASYNAAGRYCRDGAADPPAEAPMPVVLSGLDAGAAPADWRNPSDVTQRSGASAPAEPAEGAGMAMAMVRSPARMREAGNGGAAVLRVAPTGQSFRVFAFGPGGWLQVGEEGPEGWIHGSLLDVQR